MRQNVTDATILACVLTITEKWYQEMGCCHRNYLHSEQAARIKLEQAGKLRM